MTHSGESRTEEDIFLLPQPWSKRSQKIVCSFKQTKYPEKQDQQQQTSLYLMSRWQVRLITFHPVSLRDVPRLVGRRTSRMMEYLYETHLESIHYVWVSVKNTLRSISHFSAPRELSTNLTNTFLWCDPLTQPPVFTRTACQYHGPWKLKHPDFIVQTNWNSVPRKVRQNLRTIFEINCKK